LPARVAEREKICPDFLIVSSEFNLFINVGRHEASAEMVRGALAKTDSIESGSLRATPLAHARTIGKP
jgi:hypothetical protein